MAQAHTHAFSWTREGIAKAAEEAKLQELATDLFDFAEHYRMYFKAHRRDNAPMAESYLVGLIQSDRANMERMEELLPDIRYENLQHFVSESPWDRDGLMDRIARDAACLLGGHADSALVLDPTTFTKQGKKSVGVARQWNGRLGKEDNCQLGVFAALNCGERVAGVDFRLYLPKSWTDDPVRCAKAGVPEAEMQQKSKVQLGLEMVRHQRELGSGHRWVLGDNDFCRAEFLGALHDDGEQFIIDTAGNRKILPSAGNPEPASQHAFRKAGINIRDYIAGLGEGDWLEIVVRDTTRGPLVVRTHQIPVWIWDEHHGRVRHWWLLLQRYPDGKTKMALCNAPLDAATPDDIAERTRMHLQRYWIERLFEDAKGEVGLADYQLRGWRGWHNHMAMCCLSMLFILRTRIVHADHDPLLTARDIRLLLTDFLQTARPRGETIIDQIARRHARRAAAIRGHTRRNENRSL